MDFIERFDIKVNIEEAKKRFINRIDNTIFTKYLNHYGNTEDIKRLIATILGKSYVFRQQVRYYIGDDFLFCLQAIEGFFEVCSEENIINDLVVDALKRAEIDLGVEWENGKFNRSGAQLLDDKLVNDSLKWLRKSELNNVVKPFEKALDHLLKSTENPKLLSDVITDLYEALESLAKDVLRNEKDLSANRELFIKKIGASKEYRIILNDYIDYACEFRHGTKSDKKKPIISYPEVESFLYLTGLFIRLVILSGIKAE